MGLFLVLSLEVLPILLSCNLGLLANSLPFLGYIFPTTTYNFFTPSQAIIRGNMQAAFLQITYQEMRTEATRQLRISAPYSAMPLKNTLFYLLFSLFNITVDSSTGQKKTE